MSDGVDKLVRLYLIRHGETAWSLSGQHTGRTDVPLIEQGKRDARELAAPLSTVKFAHVFSSPLCRAQETCKLAGLDASMTIEPDLVEWDYGDYEGQRTIDVHKAQPAWNLFRDGCPHGESPAQIQLRADRLLSRLHALKGNVALFTHGHFGRVLAARWIGLPVQLAQHFLLSTTSCSILGFEHESSAEPVITLWNATVNELSSIAAK